MSENRGYDGPEDEFEDDDDDYDFFSDEELIGEDGPNTFLLGMDIMVETESGVEAGKFTGVSEMGLMLRITHRVNQETGEAIELGRTVLTFIPWRRIDRIESTDELLEDSEVRKFRAVVPDGISDDDSDVLPPEDDGVSEPA